MESKDAETWWGRDVSLLQPGYGAAEGNDPSLAWRHGSQLPWKKYNHLHFEQAGVSGASTEQWEEQDLESDTAVNVLALHVP